MLVGQAGGGGGSVSPVSGWWGLGRVTSPDMTILIATTATSESLCQQKETKSCRSCNLEMKRKN